MTVTVGVHGFQFDPGDKKNDPAVRLWPLWERIVEPIGEFVGFGWYSYPVGPAAVLRAWRRGHWNRYYAAWAEAEAAAARLCATVHTLGVCNLMGHSLGTRVILLALERQPNLPVRKVLLISGADSVAHALKVGRAVRVPTTNIVVPADDVLDYPGEWFTPKLGPEPVIGRTPIGPRVGPHWRDVVLADGLADDHWDAYADARNWDVLREALR